MQRIALALAAGLLLAGCAAEDAPDTVEPLAAADGDPSPNPSPSGAPTPDPSRSVDTWSPLGARAIKYLKGRGVSVERVDASAAKPGVSAAKVAGRAVPDAERELQAWEVSLVRATAKNPCKPQPSGGCKPTTEDDLVYVVYRRVYGPEFPHSQPCCNPPPFSKKPVYSQSFAIYDAQTGAFRSGGAGG